MTKFCKILVLQLSFISFLLSIATNGFTINTRHSCSKNIIQYPLNAYSKWDNLEDDDDDDKKVATIPKDMRYTEFNIMRQNQNFVAIREAAGPELTHDIYVRDPSESTFWFVGKVARVSDVPIDKAVARQYPLIEEHAVRLRPLEFHTKKGRLEIWSAPGDSEMDVAYNRPHVKFTKMKKAQDVPNADAVRNKEVGFQGELYINGEEGFRTTRTDDGFFVKPMIQSEEKRAPNDDEMKEISKFLDGKDLNEFFDGS
jgi:hypothetical protein